MKKPLKGLGTGTGLRTGAKKEFGFYKSPASPLSGAADRAPTREAKLKTELDEVGKAFRAQAKGEKERYEEAGYGANYVVMVFPDAQQTNAFMEAIGYPDPEAMFVDGTLVADLLGWELPATEQVVKRNPSVHNPKLTELARPLVSKAPGEE
jgi:hypothetical protein